MILIFIFYKIELNITANYINNIHTIWIGHSDCLNLMFMMKL